MSHTDPGIKKITTVWLEPDPNDRIKLFYCFNCRTPILEYSGRTIRVVPGTTPLRPYTVIKCKGNASVGGRYEKCGHYYTFERVDESEIIEVE